MNFLPKLYELLKGDSKHGIDDFLLLYSQLNIVNNPPTFCSDQYDIVHEKWYDNENVYFRDEAQCAKWCLFADIIKLAPKHLLSLTFSELAFRRMKEKKAICFCPDNSLLSRDAKLTELCSVITLDKPIHETRFLEATSLDVDRLLKSYESVVRQHGFKNRCSRNELNFARNILSEEEEKSIRDFWSSQELTKLDFHALIDAFPIAEDKNSWYYPIICAVLFFSVFKDIHYYVFVPANGLKNQNIEYSSGGSFFWVDSVSDFHLKKLPLLAAYYAETIRGLYQSAIDWNIKQTARIKLESTKSAIGSIMSRNGSHNIGSHVLSALSHNVGTMPDDRVLYQYIQHRMDYIATVTTDFPTWTQPTMFIGELMRDFFSQRHLLDHIAESEGLSAWEFQNPDLSADEALHQHEKIKLHIRCEKDEGIFEEVINYTKNGKTADNGGTADDNLQRLDIALAIPGGIIGNHAFYTILENVIRNAAKHGWSKLSPTTRKEENLEVTVDFKDCGEYVEFTIWDNQSDLARDNTLLERQKDRMKEPFIDGEGRLRRESWGMAEIKISAGYLAGREIGEIGGLEPQKGSQTRDCQKKEWIVEPCSVDDGPVHRLGYRFSVEKPRDVIFVLDTAQKEQEELWALVKGRITELRATGIVFKTLDEIGKTQDDKPADKKPFAARYVVLPKFDKEQKHAPLPFRVLTWGEPSVCEDMVGKLSLEDIRKALDGGGNARSLREEVEKAWLSHLILHFSSLSTEEKSLAKDRFAMVVNTEAGESGGGRGLITNADVLRFVFTNGLRTAVETFFETHGGRVSDDTAIALWALHASPHSKRPLIFGENDKVDAAIAWELLARLKSLEEWASNCLRLNESRERLELRLQEECFPKAINDMTCPNLWVRLQKIREYLECAYGHPEPDSCWVGNNTFPMWNERTADAEELCYKYQDGVLPRHEIAGFVRHLENAFCEADVFLRKYEERITTLPTGFSRSTRTKGECTPTEREICGIKIQSQSISEASKKEAMFYRHFRPESETLPVGMIYQEPLSGTQSYFNAIAGMLQGSGGQGDDDVWVSKMVECALLKICIADERVAKFLRDHPTVRNTYGVENILVLDDKWVEERLDNSDAVWGSGNETGQYRPETNLLGDVCRFVRNLSESPDPPSDDWIEKRIEQWAKDGKGTDYTTCRTEVAKKYDILVLHQGLIDKWLGETSHSKGHVAVFLGILKLYVKYVVITTGRGTPANIPPRARVLPFPSLESALFRMYPEKLVLVDTILNILPVGEQSN